MTSGFIIDPRFKWSGSFPVIVPAVYQPETALTSFGEEHRKDFSSYNTDITDANFDKTAKLTPGRRFRVKAFGIKWGCFVSSNDCLKVIAANKGVLTGAQGAALAYEQGKTFMSRKNKWFISFDKKVNLPRLGGYRRLPIVIAHALGDFKFYLGGFEGDLGSNSVLLCFCDEES